MAFPGNDGRVHAAARCIVHACQKGASHIHDRAAAPGCDPILRHHLAGSSLAALPNQHNTHVNMGNVLLLLLHSSTLFGMTGAQH